MPREKIRTGGSNVEVGWNSSPGSYVQLLTTMPDPTRRILDMLLDAGYAVVPVVQLPPNQNDTYDITETAEKIDAEHGISPPTGEFFRGFNAVIDDRQTINMLIRTLRRARDRAFGKDA